jgi:hypothetical protein
MEKKFKTGDKVVVISKIGEWFNGKHYSLQFIDIGEIYELVSDFETDGMKYWTLGGDKWAFEFSLAPLKPLINNFNNMNIKEKFLTSLKKEPEKSFRKAEITNGDDMLTEDGKAIFLTWLLQKNGADFKKEVVDELLEEQKKEEK